MDYILSSKFSRPTPTLAVFLQIKKEELIICKFGGGASQIKPILLASVIRVTEFSSLCPFDIPMNHEVSFPNTFVMGYFFYTTHLVIFFPYMMGRNSWCQNVFLGRHCPVGKELSLCGVSHISLLVTGDYKRLGV